MQINQYIHQNKKQLFIFVVMSIIIIEILIFAGAFSMSNHQPLIRIMDKNDHIVNESEARTFSVFKMYLFEKKYGALDNYRVKIIKKDAAFPFRAWFCAAFCVPMMIVFLIALMMKLLRYNVSKFKN